MEKGQINRDLKLRNLVKNDRNALENEKLQDL